MCGRATGGCWIKEVVICRANQEIVNFHTNQSFTSNIFMRKIIQLLFLLGLSIGAKAQVYNGNLTLSSQAEVDAFNYQEVTGQLAIHGADITNLNGLSELKQCRFLEIQNNSNLTSLIGLANLEQVWQLLIIDGNLKLTTLAGFSSLWKIGDALDLDGHNLASGLRIMNNPVLQDVGNFFSLLFVSRLNIHGNPLLKNIDGFYQSAQPQNQFYGDIELFNNASLEDVDGLASFSKNVYSSITIFANNSLTNVNGLANVTSAGERIFINNNPSLESIGMTHLKEVAALDLGNNTSLINLDGLSSLEKVGDLLIYNDPSLTDINGLSGLKEVSSILIQNCPLIVDVSAFSKITNVWQGVKLDGNASLVNINGFANLETIGGALQILNNASLASLAGLAKLESIGAEFHPETAVEISGNSSLSNFCDLSRLFSSVGEIEGAISIKNNGANTVTITPPADIILFNDAGLCSRDITSVAPANAVVTGCLGSQPPGHSDYPPGNIFPVGTTIITWSVTDAAGNTATAEQKVMITDNEAPVITQFPADVTVACHTDVPAADIGLVTATDNCSVVVTHVRDEVSNQTCTNRYIITRTYKATDASNNSQTRSQTITVNDNIPPQITGLATSKQVLVPLNHKMQDVTVNYTVTDNCNSLPKYSISIASNEPVNGTGDGDTDPDWEIIDDHHIRLRAERAASGSGRIYTIAITADDGCNSPVTSSTQVVVAHNITSPHSGAAIKVGSTVNFAGTFWDLAGNKHTAQWLIDGKTAVKGVVTEPSGMKTGAVTGSYKFTTPGVYKLQMNITDQKGITTSTTTNGDLQAIVVIYDPNGGYTYGGGYFASPAGALRSNPAARGDVSYGFAVNYFKNATNPKGEMQFEFKLGDLEFNAVNFEYLSVSGSKAQFSGSGRITGDQSGYGFIMTVIDGQLDGSGTDKVGMKIYNKNTGAIVYDNQPGASDADFPLTPVGANSSVTISSNTGKMLITQAKAEDELNGAATSLEVRAHPNPGNSHFSLLVKTANRTDKIQMQVTDVSGRVLETRTIFPDQTVTFGDLYRPGAYHVRVVQGSEQKQIKLIKLND